MNPPDVYLTYRCAQCGAEFKDGKCPHGHEEPYVYEFVVRDCEIRDAERFSLLTPTIQTEIISVIEAGRGPAFLYPLFLKLEEFGILICK